MKKKTKEYIDKEVLWIRDIKRTENYCLEKYLEYEELI
jgi:hypothetical protein